MPKFFALAAAVLTAGTVIATEIAIPLAPENWRIVGGRAEMTELDGAPALKITGRTVLESVKAYPVNPDRTCRMRGAFRAESDGGINRFGVRCYAPDNHVVPEIRVKSPDKYTMTLIEDCRAEDSDLHVDTVNGMRRQYGLVLFLDEELLDNTIGRFFDQPDGSGIITLYRPVGKTLQAGATVRVGYVSTPDVYFGGVLRGMTKIRLCRGGIPTTFTSGGCIPIRRKSAFCFRSTNAPPPMRSCI